MKVGWVSVVCIATCCGMVQGSNTGGGKIFSTHPGLPWGPPSLLYNGYRVSFLGWLGHGIDHPPPSSAEVKERLELYLYSPWGLQGKIYLFFIFHYGMKIFQLWQLIKVGLILAGWRVKPKLISQLTWFTPLKYLFQAGGERKKNCVCVCVRERETFNTIYKTVKIQLVLFVVCILFDSYVYKLIIVILMWGLKCTDSDLTTLFYITVDKKDYTIFLWNVERFWPVNVIWRGYVFVSFPNWEAYN